ncbi:cysteine desulfurase NifS [Shewanella dokdonensis]|uniref:Cysteine desulfurase n=1 Tax=Shewanella dokdonensis TaxID=712036 RepID=A0ABX8DBY7_9GAMM|nr:cysteine desulfurase NifS [Shewanella dokdonensis]MCL1074724.1 cysteine desulfurase NifS [Shewanella dokdonensis]QVK22299.1 cysteine desulfurase NifS [Shewanella dokdonensis]
MTVEAFIRKPESAIEMVYLDNNATTKLDPQVLEAMWPFLAEYYGNPSSIHQLGAKVGHALEDAREKVQTLLGAEYSTEIVFTSCATEATSTAILSAVEAMPERREIITSVVEHPATLQLCQHLERKGYKVHWIGVDRKGRLDVEAYRRALSEQVALVSIMWANNETGTLFPIEMLAKLAKEVGAQFHVDAVQVAGKYPINVQNSDIDMLSISGHKFHGPKGVGALYLRRGTRFRPLLRGGHQERGRRAGTENVASIIGMGVAAELAYQALPQQMTRLAMLRDRLEQGILARIPSTFVTGNPQQRVPNTSNIAIEYIEGEALLLMLNQVGIAASSGSACTSGSLEPSHVMKAMQIPFTAAHGTLRFSLSRFSSDDDVDYVLAQLPPIVERLRMLSPYWDNANNCGSAEMFTPAYA